MAAIATFHPFHAALSRTGGSLPSNRDLAWITLALLLLCGAMTQSIAEDAHQVSYVATTYGL